MSEREPHRFSIHIDPDGAVDVKWTVTCERCNTDLSGPYGIPPMQVINLKGRMSPMQFEQFQRKFRDAVANISAIPSRTLVMNADADFHKFNDANLQTTISEHMQTCGKPQIVKTPEPEGDDIPWEPCPSCTPPEFSGNVLERERGSGCADCSGRGVVQMMTCKRCLGQGGHGNIVEGWADCMDCRGAKRVIKS